MVRRKAGCLIHELFGPLQLSRSWVLRDADSNHSSEPRRKFILLQSLAGSETTRENQRKTLKIIDLFQRALLSPIEPNSQQGFPYHRYYLLEHDCSDSPREAKAPADAT